MEDKTMGKKIFIMSVVLLGVLALSSLTFAGTTPGSGIATTFPDLSTRGAGAAFGDTVEQAGLNRICVYCHAPHNTVKPGSAAANGVGYLPLWNHQVTAVSAYTLYSNGTNDLSQNAANPMVDKAMLVSSQPGGVSKLCLSCHDGSVAVNQYGSSTTSHGAATHVSARALVGGGGDLSNHHPIGFNYAAVQTLDTGINPPTAMMGVYPINDLLPGGNVECSTCHDVHNSKAQGRKLLWVEDTNSAFCLTCHVK